MLRFALFTLLLGSCVPVANAQKPESQKIDGKINWVYDYEEGKLLSESQDKPMFVVLRCER